MKKITKWTLSRLSGDSEKGLCSSLNRKDCEDALLREMKFNQHIKTKVSGPKDKELIETQTDIKYLIKKEYK